MLTWLRIKGFALIDEVELSLGAGLTVITGETGAGKSILLEALALLRGGRTSAELIRAGRDEAQVEAIFDLPQGWPLRTRLEADGRSLEDGLVARRVVARSGRSRAHLGGSLATAGELAASIGPLIDITSQHDQQTLTDPESQLAILDAFAENGALLEEAAAAWAALAALEADLATFDADARTRAEREDFLRFQLTELDEAKVQAGEDDLLKAERERIRGAEKFMAAFTRGEEVLYSGEAAVTGLVSGVTRELGALSQLDPSLGSLVERLESARALIDDVASELGRHAGQVRFDPARLSEIEERLYLLGRLCRKHGGTTAAVAERRDAIARELGEMGSFDEGLATRRAAVAAARTRLEAIADKLGERRRRSARALGKRIDETLRDLGFSAAHVEIAVEDRGELGARGRERIRFLFAPNPGEEPRALARIASGGELSRVMLACKQALAKADQALCQIFDEVDTGVGGGTAEAIGRKLKAIAAHRQVLTVTHLPQIAAFADQHLRVRKEVSKGRTTVHVEMLGPKERALELARMLGGARPSREAEAHADEMLRRACAA